MRSRWISGSSRPGVTPPAPSAATIPLSPSSSTITNTVACRSRRSWRCSALTTRPMGTRPRPVIELSRLLAKHLIAHARDAAPHEACGVVGLRGGRIVTLRAAHNRASHPSTRFEFGDHGFHVIMALEREGLDTGVYHSHPASPAYPSTTDRSEM